MSVADQAKTFFIIVAVIASIIGLISFLFALGAFGSDKEEITKARKWVFFS